MPDRIPDEVKQFIAGHITSIAALEAILLLREHRHRGWTCQEIAEWIYATEEETTRLLGELVGLGALTENDALKENRPVKAFQYAPANHHMARSLDLLAEAYAKYLVPVTNLVHRQARRSIQGFADAFHLKKRD